MKFLLSLLLSTNLICTAGLFPAMVSASLSSVLPCRIFANSAVSDTIFPSKISGIDTTDASEDISLSVSAPSVLLMEASTGTVIYEKNSHDILRPASITKIMTLILIFDALSSGQIKPDDTVTVSEYAASMGGSQVFLEPGETQTVDTMIKCISVASANDACVAMSELISGSESEFVRMMNERAEGLGMNDTTFVNCCGLDTDGHMTSANDVALMSRELITKYPEIHNYCTIWMENITHTTRKGTTEFGLTNTNKLIKQYPYATGLKTGSTSLAKYCVSATAEKDGMRLIAVVMFAPDYKIRFADSGNTLKLRFWEMQNLQRCKRRTARRSPCQKRAHSLCILKIRSSVPLSLHRRLGPFGCHKINRTARSHQCSCQKRGCCRNCRLHSEREKNRQYEHFIFRRCSCRHLQRLFSKNAALSAVRLEIFHTKTSAGTETILSRHLYSDNL